MPPQNSGTNMRRAAVTLAHCLARLSPRTFQRNAEPGFLTNPYDFFVENERIVRSGRATIIAATSVNTITLSIGSEVSDCK